MSKLDSLSPLAAVLLDFGGTLLPDTGDRPLPAQAERHRVARVREVLPELEPDRCLDLVRELHEALVANQGGLIERTDELIAQRLPAELVGRAPAVRRALLPPAPARSPLFPGAIALLQRIRSLGLRCVIVSNAALWDHDDYMTRLRHLGVALYLDGLVSSFDVGHRKPHPAMFQAGLALAERPAQSCVMVGDSERSDIEPAAAMGMRTVRVAIQAASDEATLADFVATSLDQVAAWLAAAATGRG